MNNHILSTKLYIPKPRTNVVQRQHLIDRLNEGLDRKLTLISGSAGFGKTTLVSEWVSSCDRPVAWLSLDEGDRDAIRFLNHLIAAFQTIIENFGDRAVRSLRSEQLPAPPIETILTILLNELALLSHQYVLVLDDYHAVDVPWIDEALIFMLDHLPSQLHFVITTREDPQLPLSRLRSQGHLTELRSADLRFSSDESTEFLNKAMGLRLSDDEINTLNARTEGWITGLQLAALSMSGRQDIPAFIREFAGDNRYIIDYLVEEVLQRQPEHIRKFLIQTSILDRLNGSLCDEVTGLDNGRAQLELLERSNFFVIPLDDRRQWYRYHHLFAEVLSVRLMADQPGQIAELHKRASRWFEQQGAAVDAIRHALSAKDFARAADLVELEIPNMRKSRQEATVLSWIKAIPDRLIQIRPVLAVGYAGMLISNGELSGVEEQLRNAERCLEAPSSERVVVDEEEYQRLPSGIAMYRAGLSLIRGDISTTVIYAKQVLDLASEDDQLTRGAATAILGLASWRTGDLELAYRMFADGIHRVKTAGAIVDAINGSIAMAEILLAQGQLRQAKHIYEHGLQIADEYGEPDTRGTADMYVGMSELYVEWNDLQTAATLLQRSKDMGERSGIPQNRFRQRIAMARIEEAQGNLDVAFELLNEAEKLVVNDFFPNARPVAALKARMWVLQGRLSECFDWARNQGLSIQDDLHYLREFEHITLARVYLASYQRDRSESFIMDVMGLLERLLQAAEKGGRKGSMIEILIVQALAHQMQGDILDAIKRLNRALTLAEPENYIRMFAAEGQSMAVLLEESLRRGLGISPSYTHRLLTAIEMDKNRSTSTGQVIDRVMKQSQHTSLHEQLSEREYEVLRLLRTDLSGPEIARELVVSLNTLRTHTKNIYEKLGVNSRRAAVRMAEQLRLI